MLRDFANDAGAADFFADFGSVGSFHDQNKTDAHIESFKHFSV